MYTECGYVDVFLSRSANTIMYLERVSSASRKAAEYALSGHSITAEVQYTMSDAHS